ncbi:MAG: MFS transporter [Chloroflexi bacterium]|nr:MFS transporter [Chloroflexota bacterium]
MKEITPDTCLTDPETDLAHSTTLEQEQPCLESRPTGGSGRFHLHAPHLHAPHLPNVHVPHLPHPQIPAGWHPNFHPVHLRVHTFDSFRSRNFRMLWGTTVAAAAAFWSQQLIIGWLVYSMTHSPFITGLVSGLDALPVLLAGPIGGMLVDSWDRRRVLITIFTCQSALVIGFASIVLLGLAPTWSVFLFAGVMGVGWVFADPTRMSLIPSLVPRENILNAFALNSMAFSITRLAIPAAVGLVIATLGAGFGFIVEGGLLLAAVAMAMSLRLEEVHRAPLKIRSAMSGLREGVEYVRTQPAVMGLIFAAAVPSLLAMPFVYGLMPVVAAERFHVGAVGLGALLAAVGGGATLGTVVLASWAHRRSGNSLLPVCASMVVAGMVWFALNPWFYLALPALMLMSAGLMAFYAQCNAAIASQVPDHLRGRVSGLYMLNWGVSPLGGIAAGLIAQFLGAPIAIGIATGCMVLAFAAIVFRFREAWLPAKQEAEVVPLIAPFGEHESIPAMGALAD